jgi:hypothetical protein
MTITRPEVCVWNILRYSLRNWNGKGKEHDLEKIAHYAELAWTLGKWKFRRLASRKVEPFLQ